jgi:hypothetical protein
MVSGILVMLVSQVLLALIGSWAWGQYQHGDRSLGLLQSTRAHAVLCVVLICIGRRSGNWPSKSFERKKRRSAYLEAVDSKKLWPRYWPQGYIGVQDSLVFEKARYDQ